MIKVSGSLWEALVPPGPGFSPLNKGGTADLVIIGGGFLGLSTALHSAATGLDTILLEAETFGFGASGRNTGFVVPSLKAALGPDETAKLLGEEHAKRLLRLAGRSGDKVFSLINTHGIECAASQTGWLQPAHCRLAETALKGRVPGLLATGQDVQFLSREDMRERTGLPRLYGGLLVATGGQINPLAYARGLARAAAASGAALHDHSPVQRITRERGGWRVETSKASVFAKQVLLTTNALVGTLCPQMRSSIIPVEVFQVATQPLGEDLRQRILPALSPVADTRRHTFALRWTEDHRLITGGMVPPLPNRRSLAPRTFLKRIAHQVPDCPPLSADFIWKGVIAATPDALPRIIRIDQGLIGAIGCNGRGVAMTTTLGEELAQLLSGKTSDTAFVLPVTPPRPVPLRRIAGLAPHAWLPVSNLRDAIEARHC